MSIWIFFRLIGALALLMFGMKSMSDSLQKMAGPQLRHVLGTMTTNRVTGILSGALITAAVQSSTATTVMTVSFVNAGLLTLAQAISVIMGANIGTTLTAWIMSAGFSFNITDFVWPAFFLAIILIYSKKRKIVGDFIVHVDFGIGKFGGLVRVPVGDTYQEVIRIYYQRGDIVDVSIHSLYKISKYRRSDTGEPPRLSTLGTGAWDRHGAVTLIFAQVRTVGKHSFS